MGTLFNYPKFKAFDSNGNLLVGGKLYTFVPDTVTQKATYFDSDLTTPHTNPVIMDASGEATIYFDGLYDIILTDADDVQIWTMDGVGGGGGVTFAGGTVAVGEVAVFNDVGGVAIKGGADTVITTGGVILNNGITLDGVSISKLDILVEGGATYADLEAKDGTFADLTITGDFIIGDDLSVTGDILVGTGQPIIKGTSADDISIMNNDGVAYADLHCKGIISDESGGYREGKLLFDGETGIAIATAGTIITGVSRTALGTYRITIDDTLVNPLTNAVINMAGFYTPVNPSILRPSTAEPTGYFGTLMTPYVDSYNTPCFTLTDYPAMGGHLEAPPDLLYRTYQPGVICRIVDITTTYIDIKTTVTVNHVGMRDGAGLYQIGNLPDWQTDEVYDIPWVSFHIKEVLS
ncbi:hypothetical protein M0R04_09155 [Candidatus Dojkabacteria bacterium]|jgi:hypothetical protein|nr:hypothetical protein [Candidatus Dojkabacteria bacterium]